MSTPYHTGYRVPFPMLTIVLRSDDVRLGPFEALLDSGADATLMPTRILEQMGAAEGGWATIRTHFGHVHRVQKYLISIQVGEISLPGVYVVGDMGDEIIRGRDVLNKLPLFLDGPQEQSEVLDDATVKRLRAWRVTQD